MLSWHALQEQKKDRILSVIKCLVICVFGVCMLFTVNIIKSKLVVDEILCCTRYYES